MNVIRDVLWKSIMMNLFVLVITVCIVKFYQYLSASNQWSWLKKTESYKQLQAQTNYQALISAEIEAGVTKEQEVPNHKGGGEFSWSVWTTDKAPPHELGGFAASLWGWLAVVNPNVNEHLSPLQPLLRPGHSQCHLLHGINIPSGTYLLSLSHSRTVASSFRWRYSTAATSHPSTNHSSYHARLSERCVL